MPHTTQRVPRDESARWWGVGELLTETQRKHHNVASKERLTWLGPLQQQHRFGLLHEDSAHLAHERVPTLRERVVFVLEMEVVVVIVVVELVVVAVVMVGADLALA